MSRLLDDLAPIFQEQAHSLIITAAEEGLGVVVIDTLRTEAEHLENLRRGTSWIKRSLHMDGLAIDLCPAVLLTEKGWAPSSPLWLKLGLIGERLGLTWGGRWKQRDLGHFQWRNKQ